MKIQELFLLTNVISKNKIKQIEIIGRNEEKYSDAFRLYDLLVEGKVKSEEDIKDYFFQDSQHQKNYLNRLKRKLRDKLLNTLFFIDVNQPNFTEIQKAYYSCYREAAGIKILIGKSARKPAISLAEKTIKKSIRYDFTDITLELARILRTHYATIEGNKTKYVFYQNLINKHAIIYQYELKAEEYYTDIIVNYTSSHSTKPELTKSVNKYYDELRGVLKNFNSYKLNLNSYLIFALKFEIKNDYKETLKICDEAIMYFDSKPHIASKVVIINFSLKKLICYIMLKQFIEGRKLAERCLALQPIGSINWLFSVHYYVILSFHSKEFEKAYFLYEEAMNQLNINNTLSASSEYWKIHGALIHYLFAIGKLEIKEKNFVNRFRVSKFLNDVPIYSKDKQGINISILIIQILFLLHEGKYGEIIDRTESLKTYAHRYLRRDHTFRSNCFIKMLLCLPAASFHKAGVIRKAKKFIELLDSVPIEEANQSPEVEIIPYEMLWEFILESLDNKFH